MPSFEFNDAIGPEVLDRALALQPLLRENTSVTERERRLPHENVQALAQAGLLAAAAPRRVGGLCLSAGVMARVAVTLAKACPSTAWIFCVSNSNVWTASLAPRSLQNEIFRDGVPLICGAANPAGHSQAVSVGYVVNGAWPYSSGCQIASWGVFSLADRGPDGAPAGASVFLPMSEVTIQDTWHVAGLRGTGSNTVVAKELAVPSHRYVLPAEFSRLDDDIKEPSDYVAMVPHFRSVLLGVLVGAAETILELVVAGANTRGFVFTTYGKQADSQATQATVGECAAAIDAARLLMLDAASTVDAAALGRAALSRPEQTRNRAQTSYAVELLVSAVNKLMYIGGSSAFAEKNGLQRYWRDLNVAARHALYIPNVGYEMHGRTLLGVEPTIAVKEGLI